MPQGGSTALTLFKQAVSVLGLLVALGAGEARLQAGVSILLSPPSPTIDSAPGQVINISLHNNDATPHTNIRGVQLVVKSGDGDSLGPTISTISLVEPGMLFASKDPQPIGGGNDRTKAGAAASFGGDLTIPASSTVLLGSLTLDASGLVGPFDLAFGPSGSNILNVETEFTDVGGFIAVTIDNLSATHSLTVVPEPAETLFIGMASLAVFAIARRRFSSSQSSVAAV